MWTRRQFLSRSGLGMFAAAGTGFAMSGDDRRDGDVRDGAIPDGSASKGMITPETDRTIARGLEYLRKSQNDGKGSFGTNAYAGNIAVTSLAALAFMAEGSQANRGPYGPAITKALKFVLSMEGKEGTPGFLHNPMATPHGPMYGHGFATLFLAEASGMVHDRELRDRVATALHNAVQLIIRSQNVEGGWRYEPKSAQADISVTICQIMALRAARNAGITVPKKTVDNCVAYVKRCQDARAGWFKYMAQGGGTGGQQAFARTAAGVCALYSAGIYKGQEIDMGLRFLMQYKPVKGGIGRNDRNDRPDMHYYYGHYYAVQAMWTAGGAYWSDWYPAIREEMRDRQRQDGSWSDQICNHYATAMACLILQIPNNYLPILQK